jgi:hypothetical protein
MNVEEGELDNTESTQNIDNASLLLTHSPSIAMFSIPQSPLSLSIATTKLKVPYANYYRAVFSLERGTSLYFLSLSLSLSLSTFSIILTHIEQKRTF